MRKTTRFLTVSMAILTVLSLQAQVFAAEIVLKKGKTVEAKLINITDKDIRVDLGGVELVYELGEIKSINGLIDISKTKLDELVESAHQCIKEEIEHNKTHDPFIDGGKCAEGIDILKKIDELNLPDMQMTSDVANALKKCKRHSESIPYYLKLLQQDPDSVEAHSGLGNVYRHDHDPAMLKKALAEYEKVIKIQGSTTGNQFEMGLTYRIYGKYDTALSYFKKALEIEPNSKEINQYYYENIGICCLSLGKIQEAIVAFQTVIEKFPVSTQGKAYHGLSLAYGSLGQPEKAEEYERKAKEIGYIPWKLSPP